MSTTEKLLKAEALTEVRDLRQAKQLILSTLLPLVEWKRADVYITLQRAAAHLDNHVESIARAMTEVHP